jgi:hypothetical protein
MIVTVLKKKDKNVVNECQVLLCVLWGCVLFAAEHGGVGQLVLQGARSLTG